MVEVGKNESAPNQKVFYQLTQAFGAPHSGSSLNLRARNAGATVHFGQLPFFFGWVNVLCLPFFLKSTPPRFFKVRCVGGGTTQTTNASFWNSLSWALQSYGSVTSIKDIILLTQHCELESWDWQDKVDALLCVAFLSRSRTDLVKKDCSWLFE